MNEITTTARDPLERQLQILELLSAHPRGLSFTDIRNELNLPKASANRLLKNLINAGCVQNEFETGSAIAVNSNMYLLGDRIKKLLRGVVDPEQTIAVSQAALHELAKEANETAFLSVLRGDRVENLVMALPAKDAHGYVNPGRIVPAHAAAAAKAIFAFQKEENWDRILTPPLTQLTDKTITDPDKVRAEYRHIRSYGIAYCREEIDSGLMAIAAPIHLEQLGVIYAVSIVGPSTRIRLLNTDQLEAALKHAASNLSAAFSRVITSS